MELTQTEQPIFINKTVLSKELFYESVEAAYKVVHKKYRAYICFVAVLALFFALLSASMRHYGFCVIFLLLTILVFVQYFKGHLRYVGKVYRSFVSRLPSSTYEYRFFERHYETITESFISKTEYTHITHVIESQHMILLIIPGHSLYLDKTCFQPDNYEEFIRFIWEKCPGIEVKLRSH